MNLNIETYLNLPKNILEQDIVDLENKIKNLSWELGIFGNIDYFVKDIFYVILFFNKKMNIQKLNFFSEFFKNKNISRYYFKSTKKEFANFSNFVDNLINETIHLMYGLNNIKNNKACMKAYSKKEYGDNLFNLCFKLMCEIYAYINESEEEELLFLENIYENKFNIEQELCEKYDFNKYFNDDQLPSIKIYIPNYYADSIEKTIIFIDTFEQMNRFRKIIMPLNKNIINYLFNKPYQTNFTESNRVYTIIGSKESVNNYNKNLVALNGNAVLDKEENEKIYGFFDKIIILKSRKDGSYSYKNAKNITEEDQKKLSQRFQECVFVYFDKSTTDIEEFTIVDSYSSLNIDYVDVYIAAARSAKKYLADENYIEDGDYYNYDLFDEYLGERSRLNDEKCIDARKKVYEDDYEDYDADQNEKDNDESYNISPEEKLSKIIQEVGSIELNENGELEYSFDANEVLARMSKEELIELSGLTEEEFSAPLTKEKNDELLNSINKDGELRIDLDTISITDLLSDDYDDNFESDDSNFSESIQDIQYEINKIRDKFLSIGFSETDYAKYIESAKKYLTYDYNTLKFFITQQGEKLGKLLATLTNEPIFKNQIFSFLPFFLFLDNFSDVKMDMFDDINGEFKFFANGEKLNNELIQFLQDQYLSPLFNFIGMTVYGLKSIENLKEWDNVYKSFLIEDTPFESVLNFSLAISCVGGKIGESKIDTIIEFINGSYISAVDMDFSTVDFTETAKTLIQKYKI